MMRPARIRFVADLSDEVRQAIRSYVGLFGRGDTAFAERDGALEIGLCDRRDFALLRTELACVIEDAEEPRSCRFSATRERS